MSIHFSQIKGGRAILAEVQDLKDTTPRKKKFVLGNGSDNTFILTHNLNTRDVVVSVRENVIPYEIVMTTVQATTKDAITVLFNSPPDPSEYVVTILG